MKLEAFRVQNYKKIADTDWVPVGDLVVLVGKNESGKSAILRGLSKLKPSDGEEYDSLKEFPRRRYSDEFPTRDWPVASARFAFNDDDRQQLSEITGSLQAVETAEVTAYYSGRRTLGFRPPPRARPVTTKEARSALENSITQVQDLIAPEGKGDDLAAIKKQVGSALTNTRDNLPGPPGPGSFDAVINALSSQANETWQRDLLDPVLSELRELQARLQEAASLQEARDWVTANMPQFIYFDRYDVLESAIHIPTFIDQRQRDPHSPRVRTTQCLFDHVGLSIDDLAQLGKHGPGTQEDKQIRRQIDERAIKASSGSQAMTRKFATWWEQRTHAFRYDLDGDYFRVWVSDDLDPSEIELDQRSLGMQYFFSFYLVFLVEAQEAHVNSILLLDEPALQLHGSAQGKIVEFLHTISRENQTIYTTHSPFMIDADHLETVRPVYEKDDGTTQVSTDVWPRDKDALFPLQAALGYQLTQSLFIGKRQLLVEGITDMWLVSAMNSVLRNNDREGLAAEIVTVPVAGVRNLIPLASMLLGHEVEIVALLDGDEPARKEGKKLADRLLVGEEQRCLFLGDFVPNDSAEIEDLFSEKVYRDAVKESHPGVNLTPNAEEKAIPSIVDRVTALFERRGVPFEKWKASESLRDQILDDPSILSTSTLDAFEEVFGRVNELLAPPPS